MWYGKNLQRSYKYMMFASKTPTLRIDESDLKCKNGCDYYGNSQWQGYCSKCHREQMQRQRHAEKATSASTLPKPDRKKQDKVIKLTSNSSFSKFEEKRFRQSETQKKAHLLKFSVFKKSNTDGHTQEVSEKKSVEFKIPTIVYETMKRDFQLRFPNLSAHIHREVRQFVTSFIMDVMKNAHILTVDELSERVQRQYQRFMRHMETSPLYAPLDADGRELLIDFVEKHAMSYLHELPSVLFSPSGTEDERCDRVLSERIQQLGWVGERHLDCRLDRTSPACRRLLYRAIAELLGMDGAASPGGKLARVRRCCGHVLALAADAAAPAPASADDLLPALIFTVLKANPPRLISNINFVTRFCNAARLMTGESGYYFTNLCCAVSFIENMTAESLGMDKEEFDCYMAMPASIGGSAWAATLSLCAELREAEELSSQADQLRERVESAAHRAQQLRDNTHEFENEITNKVHEVLSKTPLEIKPRREVSRLGKLKNINTSPLIDLELAQTKLHSLDSKLVDLPTPISESSKVEPRIIPQLLETEDIFDADDTLRKELGFEVIEAAQAQAIREEGIWETKHTDSAELLTPSPLGFPPFDCRSLDEAMTPDEFGSERLVPGLSAVNYDIDLSDFSADNSVAEDVPSQPPADPFSPEASKAALGAPTFEGIDSPVFKDQFTNILDSFDQLSLIDANAKEEVPFEVVHKVSDPFSPIELKQTIYSSSVLLPTDFSAVGKSVDSRLVVPQSAIAPTTSQLNSELTSLLDKNDSPVDSCLLPSPLQPQNTGGVDKVS